MMEEAGSIPPRNSISTAMSASKGMKSLRMVVFESFLRVRAPPSRR